MHTLESLFERGAETEGVDLFFIALIFLLKRQSESSLSEEEGTAQSMESLVLEGLGLNRQGLYTLSQQISELAQASLRNEDWQARYSQSLCELLDLLKASRAISPACEVTDQKSFLRSKLLECCLNSIVFVEWASDIQFCRRDSALKRLLISESPLFADISDN